MEVKTIDNFNIHENPSTNQDSFDIENYLNTNFEKIKESTNNNAEILKQLQEENEELKNQIPSVSVSENSIHVEDNGSLDFNWKIRRGHQQEVRKGYNLYNVKDVKTVSEGVTVDDDGWITMNCDNSSGTANQYINFYTNNLNLKTSTNYAIIVEIKNVTGNGNLNIPSVYNDESQFQEFWNIEFSAITANKYKTIRKTLSDFSASKSGLRTFAVFSAGKKGSITFRVSVLEDTTVNLDTFVYEKFGASPSPDYPATIKVAGNNANELDWSKCEESKAWGENGKTNNVATWAISDYQEVKTDNITFSANFEIPTGNSLGRVLTFDKDKKLISSLLISKLPYTVNFEDAKYNAFKFRNELGINK